MNAYFDGEPFDSPDLTNISLSLEQNERKSLFEGQIDSVDILGLFAAQVERTPNALAMISGSQWLTYSELNQRANQVAHYLQSLGIKPEVHVGICVERSLELSIGILGILKAGGAYVPLEPLSAQDRLAFVLKDAQVSVLLTQEHLLSSFSGCDAQMVLLDKHWETISNESINDPITSTHMQNSAYIIYTSGSSGKPKGVVVTRQALTNHCIAIMNHYHLKPSDRILQFASPSFDVAAEELFPTWASGASSILRSEQILTSAKHFLRFVVDEKLTVLNLPSSYWNTWITELVNMDARLPSTLRLVIVGSEVVLTKHAITWQQLTDGAVDLYNAYGPTETTITATIYGPVGSSLHQEAPSVPIGLPLTNVEIYILDSHLEPVSPGTPGELYIGGDGLARGYLNQPGLTAEVFIPHPFGTQPGARLYKTGDIVRSLPDGNIEFLGRLDQQVKIRGFRIELGEIEASLQLHPGVHEVIVTAREDFPGEKHLVAYIVGGQEQGPFIGELRTFLQGHLPAYMIPNAFVFLETFPLTPGGKVDRQALPAPDTIRPALEGNFVAARTQIEEKLAIIWSEVLRVDQVGIYDHFFDLGGHSLAATRIISRILDAFHVELSFRHFFHAPTVAGLAEIIEGERFNQRERLVSPIQSISRQELLPLSFAQERVWFLQQFDLSSVAYTAPSIFRLTGSLKREALEQSINELTRRHEILRTTFPPMNGQPVQFIHSPSPLRLPLIDLQHVVNQENELEYLIYEELRRPFDLTTLPLLRWKLFQLDIHEYVLVLVEHHLIHDGWSTNVLIRDLFEHYKAFSTGKALSLSEPPIQFADFAYWQRQWIQSDAAAIQLAYWKKKLEGSSPLLSLPLDRPRPTVPSFRGSAQRVQIPAFLYQSLETLIHREEVTPFMALLTVFLVFLYRSTRQEDLCVGSGIANRRWYETEGLLGMIINTIVVRTSLSGAQTFRELLGRVREIVLEVSEYQDFPFDKIVEALHPVRDLSYNPLFQVFFGLHDAPMPELEVPDLAIRLLEAPGNGSAKFDLGIIVIPRPERQDGWNPLLGTEGITMIWEYSTDLFDATTIDLMTKHYQILLESIVNDPEQRISDLPILTNNERQQLLIDWNDTQRDFPRQKRMHELFEEQVAGNPQAVAVVYEEEQLTYEELNQQVNQLAHYLRRLGVGSGAMVGVCMERSTEAIVAIIAILKAGGAYVPLDPHYPQRRLAFMLEDSHVPVLLTQQRLFHLLPTFATRIVCVDTDEEIIGCTGAADIADQEYTNDVAYVIYTSGSTGQPKGVMCSHKGALNLLNDMQRQRPILAGDACSLWTSFSFDVSVYEIFSALAVGGALHITPERVRTDGFQFVEWLHAQQICSAYIPPFMLTDLREWLSRKMRTLSLHRLLVGVEPIQEQLLVEINSYLPDMHIFNGYGPTEAAICSTLYSIKASSEERRNTPIGTPVQNAQIYLLDDQLQPVPLRVPGELYIGGEGLAYGYFNRPDLTAEKFLPHPFSGEPGSRLYKTGDLARYLPDGNLEFLGRQDHQVKIRGFRVELGEIESVLSQHPSIQAAIVVAREDAIDNEQLVAYLITAQCDTLSLLELRHYLQERLPDYMLPSFFVFLDELPVTPNGKLDRCKLPEPDPYKYEENDFVAPRDAVERALVEIWMNILQVDRIGVYDNFFALGGHSLLATRVISRIRETFQAEISLLSFFEAPTIASLALVIAQEQTQMIGNETLSQILAELEQLSEESE